MVDWTCEGGTDQEVEVGVSTVDHGMTWTFKSRHKRCFMDGKVEARLYVVHIHQIDDLRNFDAPATALVLERTVD